MLPALARLLESPDHTLVQATLTALLLFAVPDPEPLAQVATPETATALVGVLALCGRPAAAAAAPPPSPAALSPARSSPHRYGEAAAAAGAGEPSRLTCLAAQLLALLALQNADVGAAIHAAAGLPLLTALLVPSSGAKVAGAAASCILAISLTSPDGRTAVLTSGAVEKLAELSRGKADISDFLRQAMWRILKPLVPPPPFIGCTPRGSMALGASPARSASGGGASIEAAARAVAAAAGASPAWAPRAARPATPVTSHPLRFAENDDE
jgi:hypothetical protein